MKKLTLIAITATMLSTTAFAATEVTESVVVDNAITYQQSGGKAEFVNEAQRDLTETNYAHAETAKNYRNWMIKGANEGITHLRILAPRGEKAPTVQMNHDSLYSVAITKVVDGKISFEIPMNVEVYTSVQVIDQYGHGQHYVVTKGQHTVKVDTTDGTTHAFLIFRSGMEKGIEAAKANQDKLTTWGLVSGDFEVPNYDFEAVDQMTNDIRATVTGQEVYYTFPKSEKLVTDRAQWNLESALGWGGAPPVAYVSNLYGNSKILDGSKCLSTTFKNPESVYFSSITAYDAQRFLFEDEDVKSVNSNTWKVNNDNTVTVSFNCGDDALNNIDTKGQDFSFTTRFYGVTEQVIQSNQKNSVQNRLNPLHNVVESNF